MKLWHITVLGGSAIIFLGTGGIDRFHSNSEPPFEEVIESRGGSLPQGAGGTTQGAGGTTQGPGSVGEQEATGGAPNGTYSNLIAGRVGEDTSIVPNTQNGEVACAWVVNDIYRQQTGRTITTTPGHNLGVVNTVSAMESQPNYFTAVSREDAVSSGKDYIIASNPNWGGTGSHIGIGNGSTVWSNSTSRTGIAQNYTTSSWENGLGGTKYYIIK